MRTYIEKAALRALNQQRALPTQLHRSIYIGNLLMILWLIRSTIVTTIWLATLAFVTWTLAKLYHAGALHQFLR